MKKLKKQLNNSYIYIAFSLLFLPILTLAGEYVPLAGNIPGLTGTGDLVSYINALFKVALMIGIILSVLIIAYSGFEYMTIDVAMKKGTAKIRIRKALTGLLMLLAVYIIFRQINPQILELTIFD